MFIKRFEPKLEMFEKVEKYTLEVKICCGNIMIDYMSHFFEKIEGTIQNGELDSIHIDIFDENDIPEETFICVDIRGLIIYLYPQS